MKGTIVKYDSGRRFGFIRPSGEKRDDIFFHISDVQSGAEGITTGTGVDFEIGKGEKGPKAVKITLTSGGQVSPHSFYIWGTLLILGFLFVLFSLYSTSVRAFPAYLLSVNIASFILMGFDKSISGTNTMRIPEKVLFITALIGGSAGLFVGMNWFRHKTRKASFQFLLLLIIAFQAALIKLLDIQLR